MCYITECMLSLSEKTRISHVSARKKQLKKHRILVRIISLGCPKNFVATEQAAADLLIHGGGLTDSEEEADVLFINTCAFLQSAREEAETQIRSALLWKQEKKGRLVVVSGCLVNWDKTGAFRNGLPEVDAWLPTHETSTLGAVIQSLHSPESVRCIGHAASPDPARLPLTPSHYAWLRIADGCDNRCTYCLIPSIRGGLRSRPEKAILEEAGNLVGSGVRELLVIAQDTSAYGRDLSRDGTPRLAKLLRKLDKLPQGDDYLIRLLYLHPASVTDELLDVMEKMRHLVRCVEMPIQHVSGPVLKRMNRHIDEAGLRRVVSNLKERGFAVRTTFMTGFPGETEEDFRKLAAFAEEVRFERFGVFSWSEEPGTAAAAMKKKVPEEERERRRGLLMAIQKKNSRALNRKWLGKICEVIVDEVIPGRREAVGRTLLDIPEIDNSVTITGLPADRIRRGKIVPGDRIRIRVDRAGIYGITGSWTEEKQQTSETTEKA